MLKKPKLIQWIFFMAMLLSIYPCFVLQAQTAGMKKFQLIDRLQKIPTMVSSGNYSEALPELNNILPALLPMSTDDPATTLMLSQGYYLQGVCNLELQRYKDAIESFTRFLRLTPSHPNSIQAKLMLGEAYLNEGDYSKIPPIVDPLVRSRMTPILEREMGFQLISLAYINLEKWELSIPYLKWLYQNASNFDARNEAASRLAVSFIRVGLYEELYQLVPLLAASQANYDITMNLAILEEGDNFIRDSRPDLSLLMYRMVVPYGKLKGRLEQRISEIMPVLADLERINIKNDSQRQRARQLEREKEALEMASEDLEGYPDYDLELRIRLGDVYHELERWEESIQAYLSVYDIAPDSEVAERAMYAAFLTAFRAEEPDRAWVIAQEYMEKYPGGEYWQDITLHAASLLIQLERWFEAIEVVDTALEVTPEHLSIDNMLYIKAYAQFQKSAIRESIETMSTMLRNHPKSTFTQNGEYWVALGYLFLEEYQLARDGFAELVRKGMGGPVQEDANYRKGVAEYGLGNFPEATQTFTTFLSTYPDSQLASEALSMIGDMLASESELDLAIDHYKRAANMAVNMVQTDYATFQQARTFELEKRWQEILELFGNYLDQFPDQANFTEATYWQGNALRQLGRSEEALQIFYDAVVKYGNDQAAFGIDFILRDLTEEMQSVDGNTPLMLNLRERLQNEMALAAEAGNKTLLLRLQALQYDISENQELRESLQSTLLREDNLPDASPGVLALMGKLSIASNQPELTAKIYEYFLIHFEESDLILEALIGLAEIRITSGQYPEAVDLLKSVTDRFPMLPQAAEAYLRLGDVYRIQEQWAQAIETYSLILSVKEWRGELWPTSLNRLGDTHREMNEDLQASGFYERVYVLYLGYPEQAAEAYLKRGEVLIELGETSKAKEVLIEMLEKPELARQPIAQNARATLLKLP